MKAKIFTLLFGCAMISFGSMAQNFETFTIDGALTIGAIRSTGTVEVVVPADFDLTKCMVHYDLDAAAGVEIDAATPFVNNSVVNLSDTMTIKMKSTAVPAGKDVVITVKKLNSASEFPFSVGFTGTAPNTTASWNSSTIGWAFAGIDTGQAQVARYGTSGVSFIVGFPAIPAEGVFSVDYNLWSVTSKDKNDPSIIYDYKDKANSDFVVQASVDGLAWRTLVQYTATSNPTLKASPTPTPTAPIFSHKLEIGEKFVKWVYVTRDGINVNVDDITVRQGVLTAINDMELAAVAVYPNPVQGTLHLTSEKEISKVMLYSLDGQQVMQVNQPSTNGLDVQHLVKGIYLVKVVFDDQTVYTTKVTKK